MERRNFIRLSSLAAVTGAIAPTIASAKSDKANMAGGVYFTESEQGHWQGKATSHMPLIEKIAGNKIKVVTPHPVTEYVHYIVKHVVLDSEYNFIAEKMFDPITEKAPISEFDLGNYKGRIYVLSMCNQHDVWLNSADI